VAGVGTAFNPVGRYLGDTFSNTSFTNIVSTDTYLHVILGNVIKSSADSFTGSFSGQIASLKRLFTINANQAPYSRVLSGEIPLAVSVDQADEIMAVIRLKEQLGSNVSLVIVGGAQAWIIADLLASQTPPVAVVLNDFTFVVPGSSFETWNAKSNAVSILRAANIPVILSSFDGSNARNLRWLAAAAIAEGISYTDALASITRTPATIFYGANTTEGTVQVGAPANFVAYSGDPLTFDSSVELVVIKGSIGCRPVQY